ncbi:ATP-binding protein [Methanosarcinales archaeon]|nr:MAG: ATP-binding protein [Methanosarcinales archaeon]
MITIAVTGKGGTGKTVVAGMLVRYFVSKGMTVLAIDADPDSNLADVLGVDVEKTVGDMREFMLEKRDTMPPDSNKEAIFEAKIYEVMVEEEYDLLVMGRPDGPGCYCYVNNLLRGIMDRIMHNYDVVVIDTSAGLEHISRKLIRDVDYVLVVADASKRGVKTAQRIRELSSKLDIGIGKLYLILNKVNESNKDTMMEEAEEIKIDVIGIIPFDSQLAELDLKGEPIHTHLNSYEVVSQIAERLINERNL